MPGGRFVANATNIGLLLLSICLWAQDDPSKTRDAKLIRRVQAIPVSQLDPVLPPVSFEKWLHIEAGADAKFHWEVNDCGERTGTAADRGRDFPVCVEAQADMKDRRTIMTRIAVGTFKKGASGKPTLYLARLATQSTTIYLHQLSDIPVALIKTHEAVPPEITQ
jgi:hypothetical protein